MELVVIGGSDAGISAALRARELDKRASISVLLADEYPNFSICGLPFLLSGETPDWRQLAHRTEFAAIDILRSHRAVAIDAPNRTVAVERSGGQTAFKYDKLVIGTGAVPVEPPIEGLRGAGVFVLHTIGDGLLVQRYLEAHRPRSAIVIGAGYIGVEMTDALIHRGLHVTLVSRPKSVLTTVEPELGRLVAQELEAHGATLWCGVDVVSIEERDMALAVRSSNGEQRSADLVIVATGVKPSSELAAAAGLELGFKGAVRVDRSMRTNDPHIYAAGDCAETWHRLLDQSTYLPLGTTSHKQGRVAGENAVGGEAEFAGALGTQVVKVFDLVVARTGLLHEEARLAGFDAVTTQTVAWDHKAYYPGARELTLRVTGDRSSGRLLGAQILGPRTSEVSKRIDVLATALFHGMKVEEISDLDLSYTPPLSSPWDPVQIAAQAWASALGSER